jgi:hypothetical protein
MTAALLGFVGKVDSTIVFDARKKIGTKGEGRGNWPRVQADPGDTESGLLRSGFLELFVNAKNGSQAEKLVEAIELVEVESLKGKGDAPNPLLAALRLTVGV